MQTLKIIIRSAIFISFGLLLLATVIIGGQSLLKYNDTISEKVGWYLTIPANEISYNVLYTITIHNKYKKIIEKFGYPTDNLTLLKRIVAKKGDEVFISENGVSINGKLLPKSKGVTVNKNIELYPVPIGFKKILQKDEFWVMGETPTSLDSRYFGIIKRSQILQKAYFLF